MSKIITFYSYKGGVGRSMCLANVGYLLHKWGYNVLLVDWDLEAPGLENFYQQDLTIQWPSKKGIIDLLSEIAGISPKSDKSTLNSLSKWENCVININKSETANLHNETKINKLDILLSGFRDENYYEKVRSFDVKKFYELKKGGAFIEQLRNEWKEAYDYVLVDSRTGITDTSGICTIQLPDILVLLFTATEQGFNGILRVAESAVQARRKFTDRVSLLTLPIPTRFDNSEKELTDKWINQFSLNLNTLYDTWITPQSSDDSIDRTEILTLTKIPYIAYYSYGETLPVADTRGTTDPGSIGYAYQTIAALLATNLNYPKLLLNGRDRLIHLADKNYINGLLDKITTYIQMLVSHPSIRLRDFYVDIITHCMANTDVQALIRNTNQVYNQNKDTLKSNNIINNEPKQITILISNVLSNLLDGNLLIGNEGNPAQFNQATVIIVKMLSGNIYIKIKGDYAGYIITLKESLAKLITNILKNFLHEIKKDYKIIDAGIYDETGNYNDKLITDLLNEQTNWLTFSLSKKVNDLLSYYIEEKIEISSIQKTDLVLEVSDIQPKPGKDALTASLDIVNNKLPINLQFEDIIQQQLNAHAAWIPITTPYQLGDYGLISDGSFQKLGNIKDDFMISFNERSGQDTALNFLSPGIEVVDAATGEHVTINSSDEVKLNVTYKFQQERSFLINAPIIKTAVIENVNLVAMQLKQVDGWLSKYKIVYQIFVAQNPLILSTVEAKTDVTLAAEGHSAYQFCIGSAPTKFNLKTKKPLGLRITGKTGVIALSLFKLNWFRGNMKFLGVDDDVVVENLNGRELPDDL